jgi:UPF0716 protein FxsA
MWLLLAFIAVPLIEIALFIQVGDAIGLWPTLAVVVITAIIGTWMVRTQGAMAMGQLRRSFSELDDPAEPLAHGAMILFSGALLLTPGFFTDAIGFALLVPAVRHAVFNFIRKRVHVQRFDMGPSGPRHPHDRHTGGRPDIIDADYYEVGDDHPNTQGDSGWTTKH